MMPTRPLSLLISSITPRRRFTSPVMAPWCTSGVTTTTVMIGSNSRMPAVTCASRKFSSAAERNASLRRIHIVNLAVEEDRFQVDEWERILASLFRHVAETRFDCRNVLLGHHAADDLVVEVDAFSFGSGLSSFSAAAAMQPLRCRPGPEACKRMGMTANLPRPARLLDVARLKFEHERDSVCR